MEQSTNETPADQKQAPGHGLTSNISYSTKLVIGVCGVVLLTGALITWLAHRSAVKSTSALADALFQQASGHVVNHTRGFLLRAVPLIESLRDLKDSGLATNDPDRLAPQLLTVIKSQPGLSWVSFSDEAGSFTAAFRTGDGGLRITRRRITPDGHSPRTDHEVLPDGTWKVARQETDSGYDPRKRPFYTKAKQEDRLVWIPPYVLFDSGLPGIACAAPVHDAAGKLLGVLTVEFDLNSLCEFVGSLSVSRHSQLFVFTPDQTLLAHPNQPRVVATGKHGEGKLLTLADFPEPVLNAFREHLRPELLAPGGSGDSFNAFRFNSGGEEYEGSTTAFRLGDDLVWVVGAAAPRSDFLAGVWKSQRAALSVALVSLLLAAVLSALLARRVSGPVQSMLGFMRRVGGGELDTKADFGASREFRQVADAMNRMIADLRDRLRLRHSLDVAMEVQQRLLPRTAPKVPGLDIAGHSTYCDETGGDYYDFLIVDQTTPGSVIVALGDVMGHGVAAALVMAAARAVLRDRAQTDGSLADLMGRLNQMISKDLEGSRFMTMHLAVCDTNAHSYRWCSAGHDPAIIYDPTTSQFIEHDAGDFPLGVMSDGTYEEHVHNGLHEGQVIVVGTDGVWEMPNATGEQFGKDRLRDAIRSSAKGNSAGIVEAILASLKKFRGETRPADDVTFVVLKLEASGASTPSATAAKS